MEDLTLKQAREILEAFSKSTGKKITPGLNDMIGKYVIVSTFCAGIWAGVIDQKSGNEVILCDARFFISWNSKNRANNLPTCAIYGIDDKHSDIEGPLERVWLEVIEIIPCTDEAAKTIASAKPFMPKTL